MFHYNYIVPTGPSGYYNYNSQASSASTTSQTLAPAPTGTATDYYGSNPPPTYTQAVQNAPGVATATLAQLIPDQAVVHSPRQNPRLAQLYPDVDQWLGQPTPEHETRYLTTVKDFEKWMKEVFNPKMHALENLRAGLEGCQQRIHAMAEDSCRLGSKAFNFLTEHLEIGDVFDLLISIERRLEEIYQDLLNMDELKIDIESNTNASDCYSVKKTKYAHGWETYKEATKTTARRNFQAARTARKKLHYEKLLHYTSTAGQIDFTPYQAIIQAIAVVPPINSQYDADVLGRTLIVLKCAIDQDTYINGLAFTAHGEYVQQNDVHEPMVGADYSQQNSFLARQQEIILQTSQSAANQRTAVENHFHQNGVAPIHRLLEVYRNGSGACQLQGAMQAMSLQQNLPMQSSTYSPPQQQQQQQQYPAQQPAAGDASAPKFQMPLSWYSNMLTQQHVTNMQVMNNVGGGSSTFHLANSSGSILY